MFAVEFTQHSFIHTGFQSNCKLCRRSDPFSDVGESGHRPFHNRFITVDAGARCLLFSIKLEHILEAFAGGQAEGVDWFTMYALTDFLNNLGVIFGIQGVNLGVGHPWLELDGKFIKVHWKIFCRSYLMKIEIHTLFWFISLLIGQIIRNRPSDKGLFMIRIRHIKGMQI